jgi:hypothetical protein
MSDTFTPGPIPNTVRTADGKVPTIPDGWILLPPGDAALSDFSPYGHGLFGNMICFRANKVGYVALPSGEDFDKDAYFGATETVSEMVQETHLCRNLSGVRQGRVIVGDAGES